MVRNIREIKFRGKIFSSKQARRKYFNAEYYLHAHTYMYVHPMKFSFITCAVLIRMKTRALYY